MLLHLDGSTITRDARQHLVLAYRCQSALDERTQESGYQKDLTKLIGREKRHLLMLENRLDSRVVGKYGRCFDQLERQFRQNEFDEFVAERTELPAALQAELDAAAAAVDAACAAVHLLEPEPLEQLRLATEPPNAALRECVEATAVIVGVRTDFSAAQAWLGPTKGCHPEVYQAANPK